MNSGFPVEDNKRKVSWPPVMHNWRGCWLSGFHAVTPAMSMAARRETLSLCGKACCFMGDLRFSLMGKLAICVQLPLTCIGICLLVHLWLRETCDKSPMCEQSLMELVAIFCLFFCYLPCLSWNDQCHCWNPQRILRRKPCLWGASVMSCALARRGHNAITPNSSSVRG